MVAVYILGALITGVLFGVSFYSVIVKWEREVLQKFHEEVDYVVNFSHRTEAEVVAEVRKLVAAVRAKL